MHQARSQNPAKYPRIQSHTVAGAGVPCCHDLETLTTLCGNTVMFKTCYGRIQRIWTKYQNPTASVSQTKKSDATSACQVMIRTLQEIPTSRPSTTGCFGRGGVQRNSSQLSYLFPKGSLPGIVVAAPRPPLQSSPPVAILAQGSQLKLCRSASAILQPPAMNTADLCPSRHVTERERST